MTMKRDSRPVAEQVLSGLKIGTVILAIGAGVLICFYYIPKHRIEAYFWHLRHGHTIDVGQYRVPVPQQWYVERISENDAMLINLTTGDSILALTNGLPKPTLSAWSNLTRRSANETMKPTGQRDFRISGESFLCIEQDFRTKTMHLYPIQCRSDGGFEVIFQPYFNVRKEHDGAFYSLLQRIQKL